MKKSTPTFAVILFSMFTFVSCSEAEDSKNEVLGDEEAVLRLDEVLDRAVEVYGGREFLAGIENLEVQRSGWRIAINQNRTPYENDRYLRTIRSGYQRETDNYYSGADLNDADSSGSVNGVNTNFIFSQFDGEAYLRFPPTGFAIQGFAPGSGRAKFVIPHTIIEELNKNREKVVWSGQEIRDGKTYDRVSYSDGIQGDDVFLFDAETGYLTMMESTTQDIALGKVVWITIFGEYYQQDGTVYPKTNDFYFGDVHQSHYEFDFINFDAKFSDGDFVPGLMDDFQVTPAITPGPTAVRKYDENIYGTTGNVDTLFVEFDDYVIVFGVSFNNDFAHEQLDLIHEAFGDKLIRFAIPSHHHQEHIGGLRMYVNQGIPIITTSRNRPYFDQVVRADHSLFPDDQQENPKEPVFEIVNNKRVFEDSNTRLEIINIGPIGHSEDMFVAWLPEEKLVFTEDLFHFHSSLPLKVSEKYRELAMKNYEALKNADIDAELFVQYHGEAFTKDELEEAFSFDEDE